MAPLGPLRKCLLHTVLHISILTPFSHPSLCGRNRVLSVFFEAELEARHCSRIFHWTWDHVPVISHSVGEKVPSYLQPGCLLPQVQRAVRTSGCSPPICCKLEPCPTVLQIRIQLGQWIRVVEIGSIWRRLKMNILRFFNFLVTSPRSGVRIRIHEKSLYPNPDSVTQDPQRLKLSCSNFEVQQSVYNTYTCGQDWRKPARN